MKLKRNVLTIFYTIPFLLLTAFGLFQMINLTISAAPDKYIVTGVIVFGLILYLILAFFLKEASQLQFLQKGSILLAILEILIVFACSGCSFYLDRTRQGMSYAVIFTLLLLCLYMAARLCGGRLCGLICLAVSFFYLPNLAVSANGMVSTSSAVSMLCFLIPFIVFLGIQRILIPAVGENGFFVVTAYLVLGFLFSLAIALTPLVLFLLAGCVFSLLFSSFQKENTSVWAKGVFCAAYLVIFSACFLLCIRLLVPDLMELLQFNLDRNLPLAWELSTLKYVVAKYTKPVIYLHLPFQYGVLPTLLFFFSVLSGYYVIRKKSSYLGPVILSCVASFVSYIFFQEGGSQFYELTYLLPLFASYGFTNTLLHDEPVKETDSESVPEMAETDGEPEEMEEKPEEEPEIKPEVKEESVVELIEKPEVESSAITEEVTDTVPEKESPLQQILQKQAQEEIPEWTIPKEFLPEQTEEEYLIPEEAITPAPEILPVAQEEEPEDVLDLDQLVTEETDQVDTLLHNGDNDIEQFVTAAAKEGEDSVLNSPKEENDESLLADISAEEAMPLQTEEETEETIRPEETEETEATQLQDLLERLDISEPIKRMNESAQEDMADVIERKEEKVELSEALPLKPSKSTLPKYKKPDFDFEIEPVTIPLDDQYSNISEYDEVPTVHDLENQWKAEEKPVIETVATKIEEPDWEEPAKEVAANKNKFQDTPVHSEEIVRKNGIGKRSYHRITIR